MDSVVSLLPPLLRLQAMLRDRIVRVCGRSPAGRLSRVAREANEDTIYTMDRLVEKDLLRFVRREIAVHAPVILIAEGVCGGRVVLPRGTRERDAAWRIIMDPIDGTRGLMHGKRSAWILTGVAPNRGAGTTLADIELAVQTEIPLAKQHLSDVLWAEKGKGMKARRFNRLDGTSRPVHLAPTRARSIAHGFATVTRLFPGAREELSAMDEEMIRGALGPAEAGRASCFEDQYASTGGQLSELVAGHDAFVADLRPLAGRLLAERGLPPVICCHPYDICTELIAREAGVIVTDPAGKPLATPLSVEGDVAWVGYANRAIRAQMEPHLRKALKRRDLLIG
ncbi:MAG: inositol monophosphatase [Planctomycetota bacterium]